MRDKEDKWKKRISILDILSIEPSHKLSFVIHYIEHEMQESGGFFSSKKSIAKQNDIFEEYQSRHLAEIIYAYNQILETIEREEKELSSISNFFQNSADSDHGSGYSPEDTHHIKKNNL